MKNTLFIFSFLLLSCFSYAQNKQKAEKLVARGVTLNDEGHYSAAISKYDEALKIDKDNLTALAEKALTLYNLNLYGDAVRVCKRAIKEHRGEHGLRSVYVTYGSVLDVLEKTGKSLKIYSEGIKLFPDFYALYFNKGVTLARITKFNKALKCFQNAVKLNPQHASSHNAIARILYMTNKKTPSLLALCRFLMIEPKGNRGKINLQLIQTIINGDAKKTEKNHSSALDYSETNANKTAVQQFIRKFKLICASLAENKKDHFGFYWTYYVPYFIEMRNKKLISPFAYMIFASAQKKYITQWITSHQTEITKLGVWDKLYKWPGKLH